MTYRAALCALAFGACTVGPAVALSGCAVGPNFERPKAPEVKQYTAGRQPTATVSADQAQRFLLGREVTSDWWHLFRSRAVDAIIARALVKNYSLEAARASLRRSRDAMRAGYGAFFPQVDAQAGASYQRASPLRFGLNQPPTDFALYTVSGTVSYAIDIWGGERRQVEALTAQVEAQRYVLAGARVMLCGNVIDAIIAQAGYRAQIAAARATVELEKEQLRITEAQANGGAVPFANVLSIKAQVASTEALVPQFEQKIDESDHLIATLAGEVPGAWTAWTVNLEDFTLPADVPVSLPSKLVRQRPDILVAEALLHAANAEIGVATAAMLPNVTLSASGGGYGTKPGHIFDANGLFGSVGGGLTAPVFHGGTLWYERKGRRRRARPGILVLQTDRSRRVRAGRGLASRAGARCRSAESSKGSRGRRRASAPPRGSELSRRNGELRTGHRRQRTVPAGENGSCASRHPAPPGHRCALRRHGRWLVERESIPASRPVVKRPWSFTAR